MNKRASQDWERQDDITVSPDCAASINSMHFRKQDFVFLINFLPLFYLLIYILIIMKDFVGFFFLRIIVKNTESDGSPRNRKQWQGADKAGSSTQNAEEKAEIRAAGWHPGIVNRVSADFRVVGFGLFIFFLSCKKRRFCMKLEISRQQCVGWGKTGR